MLDWTEYVIPLALPFFWMGGLGLISLLGWRSLAEVYRRRPDGPGRTRVKILRFCSLRMSGISYGSCVTLDLDQEGMTMSMLLPFRFAHPAVWVPWSEISMELRKSWFWSTTQVHFRRAYDVKMTIDTALANKIKAVAGDKLGTGLS